MSSTPKVFVCYSGKDRPYFDRLMTHLAPRVKAGQLEVWSDQQIGVGEAWDAEIEEAMQRSQVAVVLVSPHLFETAYVTDKELPTLMAAHLGGQLRLAPLFVHHANAHVLAFKGHKLTDLQGLNRPDDPLADKTENQLHRELTRCAEELWRLASPLDAKEEKPHAEARYELTVALERKDRTVVRRYSRRHSRELQTNQVRLDPGLDASVRSGDRRRTGESLFQLLLGSRQDWEPLLRHVFGHPNVNPIRHGLRLRIVTRDPYLRALPWGLARWDDYDLARHFWTFEVSGDVEPRHIVARLNTPCTFLTVGAELAGQPCRLDLDVHHASLVGLMNRAWNNVATDKLTPLAKTQAQAEEALGRSPSLVYVYCHVVDEGRSGLKLVLEGDGGQPVHVSFSTLVPVLEHHRPRILFLHTVGALDGAHTHGEELSAVRPLVPVLPDLPLVIHWHSPAGAPANRHAVQRFWSALFEDEWKPVAALHELGLDVLAQVRVETSYETWETVRSDVTPKAHRPRFRLNRIRQRDRIRGAIQDLVRRRRVMAAMAYAESGNLVEHFAAQMIDTLRQADFELVRPHHVPLYRNDDPTPRRWDPASLEERLREVLQVASATPLKSALSGHIRAGGPRATPLLILDWGCYGEGFPHPLTGEELESWLRFTRDTLEGARPPHARILSYLSLVSPRDRHGGLEDLAATLKKDPASHFDFVLLPPLDRVTPEELAHFLEDPANSSCPAEYFRRDLPQRICHKTGGEFKKTVELLEKAEAEFGWPELDQTLDPAPLAPEPRKDRPL